MAGVKGRSGGHNRKSLEQHLRSGTFNATRHRHLRAVAHVYPIAAPDKPAHVEARADASAEWDRIVPILIESRVLTPAFRASLEAYCSAYADVVEGERLKAATAPYVVEYTTAPDGSERERLRPHPVLKIVNDARKELRQWALQLGLTATSAGKVSSAPPAPEPSPLAQLRARRADIRRVK